MDALPVRRKHPRNRRRKFLPRHTQTMIHIPAPQKKAPKFTQGKISQNWALTTRNESHSPCTARVYKGLLSRRECVSGNQGSLTSFVNSTAPVKVNHHSIRDRLSHKRKYAPQKIVNYYSRPDVVVTKQEQLRVARHLHSRGELAGPITFGQPQGYWDWLYWNDKDEYYRLKYGPSTNAILTFCTVCDKTDGEFIDGGVCWRCIARDF